MKLLFLSVFALAMASLAMAEAENELIENVYIDDKENGYKVGDKAVGTDKAVGLPQSPNDRFRFKFCFCPESTNTAPRCNRFCGRIKCYFACKLAYNNNAGNAYRICRATVRSIFCYNKRIADCPCSLWFATTTTTT